MKKIKKYLRNALVGLIIGTGILSLAEKAKANFNLKYGATNNWEDYYSDNSELKPNDEVGVFVNSNDPNVGKFCIGRFVVQDANSYGFMHVYRDDDTTPYKDGAEDNDNLEFKIWDSQKNKVFSTITTPNPVIFGQAEWNEVDIEKRGYNFQELDEFAYHWLEICDDTNNDCDYLGRNNQYLDFIDFAKLAEDWGNYNE